MSTVHHFMPTAAISINVKQSTPRSFQVAPNSTMIYMAATFVQPTSICTLRSLQKYQSRAELSTTPHRINRTALHSRNGRALRMNFEEEGMKGDTEEGRNDVSFQLLASEVKEYLKTCSEDEPSPLAYNTLRKAGRMDLISRIMDAGGYINVAKALGVRVDQSPFVPSPKPASSWDEPSSGTETDNGASLALGRGLEERLSTIADVMKKGNGPQYSEASKTNAQVADDVPTGEQLRLQNDTMVPSVVDKHIPVDERFKLRNATRIGVLSLAMISAIGYGKSSYILSDDIVLTCRALASGLLFAHILLGIYAGATLAPQKRRNRSLWFAKVCLGGPLEMWYLGGLDELPD